MEPPSSSTAAPPEPTEDGKIAEPADQQEQSTVASALSSAANTASTKTREAASDAAAAVTDAGETVADTARDLSSSALDNAVGRSSTPVPTVYIGNLFFDVTEETLRREMGRFGDINMIRLIVDSRGLSKGYVVTENHMDRLCTKRCDYRFAYVEFKDQISADRCIEEMNQQIFEGRRISVQYTIKKENRPPRLTEKHAPTRTLFIGNMSFEMSDQDLNDLFREIRNVIDVRVAIDRRTGQPRGFAHADFVDVASAEEAMKQLDGKEIYGRRLRLDFSENPSRARTST